MSASIRILSLLSIVLSLLLTGCDKSAADRQAIQKLWTDIEKANTSQDGISVGIMYSKSTYDHYTRLIKLAVSGTRGEVLKEPPSAIAEILGMRLKYKKKQLEKFDGRGFIAYATSQGGWNTGADGMILKSFKFTGDTCNAKMYDEAAMQEYRDAKTTPSFTLRSRRRFGWMSTGRSRNIEKPPEIPVRFVREDGLWKLDETSMFPNTDNLLLAMAREERMKLPDLLVELALAEHDGPVPKDLWEPMK
jgi:hypothetical protein